MVENNNNFSGTEEEAVVDDNKVDLGQENSQLEKAPVDNVESSLNAESDSEVMLDDNSSQNVIDEKKDAKDAREKKEINDIKILEKKKQNLSDAMMMLNLFRQAHVIKGGFESLNSVFKSADDDVVEIIKGLPGGNKLYYHCLELKKGEVKGDEISEYLLPFGPSSIREFMPDYYNKYFKEEKDKKPRVVKNTVDKNVSSDIKVEAENMVENKDNTLDKDLNNNEQESIAKDDNEIDTSSLNENARKFVDTVLNFEYTPDALLAFKDSDVVKPYLPDWSFGLREYLDGLSFDGKERVRKELDDVISFSVGYNFYKMASEIVSGEREVDKIFITSRMKKYEKYLMLFGDAGKDILEQLKKKLKDMV